MESAAEIAASAIAEVLRKHYATDDEQAAKKAALMLSECVRRVLGESAMEAVVQRAMLLWRHGRQ